MRINWCLEQTQVILRYLELPGATKPNWWRDRVDHLVDVCSWYAYAAELAGIDRAAVRTLPPAGSQAAKALTVAAHKLNAQEWAEQWAADVRMALVKHVTLGRACAGAKTVSGWTKKEKSLSNRVAHGLTRELERANLAITKLGSLTV